MHKALPRKRHEYGGSEFDDSGSEPCPRQMSAFFERDDTTMDIYSC